MIFMIIKTLNIHIFMIIKTLNIHIFKMAAVLLLLCDVIPETEYEWILLIEVLFSY